YADVHPPIHEYDTVEWDTRFGTDGVALNAPGIPEVSAAAIAELATTLGQRHSAGKTLIGHALQLRHRLPHAWLLMQSYSLPPRVARKLADHTFWCNADTAASVDRQVSVVAGQLTLGQVERLVTAAILQFDPDHPDHDRLAGTRDPRGVWIHHSQDGRGLSYLSGTIDVHDGLTLDAALDVGARDLAAQPGLDNLTHQALRGYALGDLSRRQPGLDLIPAAEQDQNNDGGGHAVSPDANADTTTTDTTSARDMTAARDTMAGGGARAGVPATAGTLVAATPHVPIRRVTRPLKPITLYVHLHESALIPGGGSSDGGCSVGRVETTSHPVTANRIREWLGDPAARIIITPVMHTGEQIHTDAYEIPDRLIRQIELTELTCVFPWCDKPATNCDKDHQIPYHHGGTTSSTNLAPLCRTHHLLKTHTRWRYQRLHPDQSDPDGPDPGERDPRPGSPEAADHGADDPPAHRQPAPSGSVDHGPVYLWTSPYGHRYRRTRLGTTADPPDNSG
ncbi:MAG: HNH endonuclease, partial [Propionibacteriales bacterium]|nr:HNH endonuclease [Propionibacteriales bacterium]